MITKKNNLSRFGGFLHWRIIVTGYFFWSGVILNIIFISCLFIALLIAVIIPAIEAFSMLRWWLAIEKRYPAEIKLKRWWVILFSEFSLGGRRFESKRCQYGSWSGIGKWEVYGEEEDY